VLWPHDPANTRGDATVSPDEASAAVIDADGRVELVDLRRGSSRTLGEIALPRSRSPGFGPTNWDARVSFAPDGRWVAASSADGTIQLFPTAGGPARALAGHQGTIFGLAFTPDSRTLISAGQDGNLRLWEVASGTGSVLGSGESLRSIALSASGRWLASGDKMGGVKLWDLGGRRLARTLEGGENIVLALAFSPDERQLAAASYDHVVRLWDLGSGRRSELTDATSYVDVVAFSPDGTQLAYAGADGVIRLRDLRRGGVRELRGAEGRICALAFSPDGTRLASGEVGGRAQARLWQIDSGESRAISHVAFVKYVRWSRDGRAVYSGGYELRRWSDDVPVEAGTLRKWIDAHTDLVAPRVGDPDRGD
jgi:WD40 repeat protein